MRATRKSYYLLATAVLFSASELVAQNVPSYTPTTPYQYPTAPPNGYTTPPSNNYTPAPVNNNNYSPSAQGQYAPTPQGQGQAYTPQTQYNTRQQYTPPQPAYNQPASGYQRQTPAYGQQPSSQYSRQTPVYSQQQRPQRSPYRLAERTQQTPQASAADLQPQKEGEHPMMPALRWARSGLSDLEKMQDYSATLVKCERVGGTLKEPEYMFVKVRHHPFSVYGSFLAPANVKGQEVIYVDGANSGKMWAHTTGIQDKMFGTVSLPPDGMLAMRGQRYPITEIGVLNLTRRLVEVAEHDIQYGECNVTFYKGAKINDRVCTCIEAVHPIPRRNFLFHIARIFVDDELNIPIRYESYDWPKTKGGPPGLIEQYTYLNLRINNGFTDADFDVRNPNYKFR